MSDPATEYRALLQLLLHELKDADARLEEMADDDSGAVLYGPIVAAGKLADRLGWSWDGGPFLLCTSERAAKGEAHQIEWGGGKEYRNHHHLFYLNPSWSTIHEIRITGPKDAPKSFFAWAEVEGPPFEVVYIGDHGKDRTKFLFRIRCWVRHVEGLIENEKAIQLTPPMPIPYVAAVQAGIPIHDPPAVALQQQELIPRVYLTSWAEILNALGKADKDAERNQVRQTNKTFEGPIIIAGSGSSPKVEKSKLLSWWNGLEDKWREREQARIDKNETVKEQYQHGKSTVVPQISGHVKNRKKANKS